MPSFASLSAAEMLEVVLYERAIECGPQLAPRNARRGEPLVAPRSGKREGPEQDAPLDLGPEPGTPRALVEGLDRLGRARASAEAHTLEPGEIRRGLCIGEQRINRYGRAELRKIDLLHLGPR